MPGGWRSGIVMDLDMEIFWRLAVASILGGLVGLERERLNRAAGLRTHVLVSVGSALFTMVSIHGFNQGGPEGRAGDEGRVAAQIVSGIGFLGAGAIMKQGATVRGLTTAATLWVVAGIGMAAGCGFFLGAVLTTLVVLLVLVLLKLVEKVFGERVFTSLDLRMPGRPGQMARLQGVFESLGVTLRNLDIEMEGEHLLVRVMVLVPKEIPEHTLVQGLEAVGVSRVEVQR